MKKMTALILAIIMVFALFACGKKNENTTETSGKPNSGESSALPGGVTTTVTPGTTSETPDDKEPEDPNGFHQEESFQTLIAQNGHTLGLNNGLSESETYNPSKDAVLRVGVASEPAALCTYSCPSASKGNVDNYPMSCNLFNKNTVTGAYEAGVNTVGESWEWIDDTHMRIVIRDDVTSINGDKFTASDLLYTYNWASRTNGHSSNFTTVDFENCKVVSDTELVVAFTAPTPFFTKQLATYHLYDEQSVEAAGGETAVGENPIAGVGPYKLVEWNRGISIIYERRDDFWGVEPYYAGIEMYVAADVTARAMGLESGDFDVIFDPSLTSVVESEKNDAVSAYYSQGTGMIELYFNSANEIFKNKAARQAVALAINYEAIISVAGKGYGAQCDSCFTQVDECYVGPEEGGTNFWHYDVEAAKAKLIEAGYPDGFKFSLTYKSGDSTQGNTVEILKNNLAQIGIELELDQLEAATWAEKISSGTQDSYLASNSKTSPARVFSSYDPRMTYKKASGGCGTDWTDKAEEVGKLMDDILVTVDVETRMGYLKQLQDIIREEVPSVPIFSAFTGYITSKDIVNLTIGSSSDVDVKYCYPAEYIA